MRRGRVAAGVAGTLALAGLVWLAGIARERRQEREHLNQLSEELAVLRAGADSCQGALAREEADFHAYDRRIDSLLEEVREYEALDEAGVPRDRYGEYMDAYERYNSSVPAWEEQAEALRVNWEACRALVGEHNTVADSLRGLIEEREGRGERSGGDR